MKQGTKLGILVGLVLSSVYAYYQFTYADTSSASPGNFGLLIIIPLFALLIFFFCVALGSILGKAFEKKSK